MDGRVVGMQSEMQIVRVMKIVWKKCNHTRF